MIEVTDSNFDREVLQSSKPVLIDFWAPWCGPCKSMSPILEEIASELANELKVVKINSDECPELSARYGVRSIPNFVLVKNGVVENQIIGAMSKANLLKKLK